MKGINRLVILFTILCFSLVLFGQIDIVYCDPPETNSVNATEDLSKLNAEIDKFKEQNENSIKEIEKLKEQNGKLSEDIKSLLNISKQQKKYSDKLLISIIVSILINLVLIAIVGIFIFNIVDKSKEETKELAEKLNGRLDAISDYVTSRDYNSKRNKDEDNSTYKKNSKNMDIAKNNIEDNNHNQITIKTPRENKTSIKTVKPPEPKKLRSADQEFIYQHNKLMSGEITFDNFTDKYMLEEYILLRLNQSREIQLTADSSDGPVLVYNKNYSDDQYQIAILNKQEMASFNMPTMRKMLEALFDVTGSNNFSTGKVQCISPAKVKKTSNNTYQVVTKGIYNVE